MNGYIVYKFFGTEYDIEKIDETVAQLEEFGCARTEDVNELQEFVSALRSEIRMQLLDVKYDEDFEPFAMKNIGELYSVLEKYENIKIYNSSKVDLFNLHSAFTRAFYRDGYCRNSFYEFMNLVKGINAYYKISNPTNAFNRVAYGWNQAYKKTESERYLYACIRNYLSQNNVEFTTKDLQGIVFGNF